MINSTSTQFLQLSVSAICDFVGFWVTVAEGVSVCLVAVGTGVIRIVAVLSTAILAGTVFAEVHRHPGIPGAILTTAVGAVTFVGLAATTARTTAVVLTRVTRITVLRTGVVTRAREVAAVVGGREGQPTTTGRVTDKATGRIGPGGLAIAR